MDTYGYFSDNGFVITERETPRHWYNYLYNDEYITCISQVGFGQGFAQDKTGHRIRLVEDRTIYIADGTDFWQATGLPVTDKVQNYKCLHGYGYTDIELTHNLIRTKCRLFVPNEGKREFLSISVRNQSKQTKTLKIIPYIQTAVDSEDTPQTMQNNAGYYSEEKNAVIVTGHQAFDGYNHREIAYLTCNDTATGYDSRQSAFIGMYGNKNQPKAMIKNSGCTNSECIAEKVCLALQNTVTLAPGENKVFYYTIGTECDETAIPQFSPDEIKSEFSAMQRKYKEICGSVSIHTPSEELNSLFNDWLKYQTNLGSLWGPISHNRLRDMISDTECFSCIQPSLAADRLCVILQYQYATGYVPYSFTDGTLKDHNCADTAVWAVFAAYSITKELGTTDFLLREVSFNNGEIGTVYEHIKRAVSFLWKFTGHNGLIKIWGGDWTESLNAAGFREKGISVWLSIAFVRAAKMFAQIANWLGKQSDAKNASYYAQQMQARVDQYGWNGDRYLYAVSDDKDLIGAKECKEGRIFAMPQIWSVLAEFDAERTVPAMASLERELNTELGILISKPPYTLPLSFLGEIVNQYPGTKENGGIRLNAGIWKLAADSMLNRNDKIKDGLHKILPFYQQFSQTNCEPYVLPDCYMGVQTGYQAGKPGQSWTCGCGAQLMYVLVRYIFGLQPEFGGILPKPCLPPDWKDCSISKVFHGCRYNFHFIQKDDGNCNTIESIYVNGHAVDPTLPIKPQSGKSLDIEITLRNITNQ